MNAHSAYITLNQLVRQGIIGLLRGYQYLISPLFPGSCRFYPTCSEYAIGVFRQFGILKGTSLIVLRLTKCHPFHPGGIDPIPEKQQISLQPTQQK